MRRSCSIRRGFTAARDELVAAQEIHAELVQSNAGLVVLFCSSHFNLATLGPALKAAFGNTTVIGCTTAGEITPLGYREGSITGFSFHASECHVVPHLISHISQLQVPDGGAVVAELLAGLEDQGVNPDPADTFSLLLIDGMCANEELVLSSLHRSLSPIQLLGGSAGDDMRLEGTHIYWDGVFHADAALLTMIKLSRPFRLFRRQHFSATTTRMVVTCADTISRTVNEINAEPAAEEYARIIGVKVADLTPLVFAEFPLMVKVDGDHYVRAIKSVNPDGSLTFFCAIDVGVVLTLGQHEDMIENLNAFFREMRVDMGEADLVIGFECFLRVLESENRQIKTIASRIMADNNVVGFCSYGEQTGSMHFNQTFTGLYIGAEPTIG